MRLKMDYMAILLLLSALGMQSCCSSRSSAPGEQQEITTETPPALPPAPLNLPAGAARIIAIPVSIERLASGSVCLLKVEQVIGYGMAAPLVTVGSEVRVELVSEQDQQQLDQFNSAFKQKSALAITLHSAAERTAGIETPRWRVLSIDKTLPPKSQEE
jgi:hypothetical protein